MDVPPSAEDRGPCDTFLGVTAIFHSEVMRDLMDVVGRVARSDAAVLITGETGVGKELISRAIHAHSLRCSKPWVDVNCAALPEHLVESELFGYEKGAFSGAQGSKQGLFELAHTGTLFLDEVGELEPRMQIKLLRVLDGVPYFRLGGVRKVSVDTRIVAASNQNFEHSLREGKFRSDLYHRLAQVQLHIPALRERPDDILPLAEFFLKQQDSTMTFTFAAVEAMRAYHWPGNARELRNVVVRAALLAPGKEITPSLLALPLEDSPSAKPVTQATTLEGMEREMILRVLNQTGGHHTVTAKLLGISRRTLNRKLKAYGVQDESQSRPCGEERADDRKAPRLPEPVRG